jgi:hypothetical protein
MWDAKVYFLAIVIAFFSGGWPFIKLGMMVVGFFTPPGLISLSSRETLLVVLDALGKWSLIDFFVMFLLICAFYIQMPLGDNIRVDVVSQPRWGFYSFVVATMISLLLSHILLACHRFVVEPKVLHEEVKEFQPKESLSTIVYELKLAEGDLITGESLQKLVIGSSNNANNENNTNRDELEPLVVPRGAETEGEEKEVVPLPEDPLLKKKSSFPSSGSAASAVEKEQILCVKFTPFGRVFIIFLVCLTTFFIIAGAFLKTMGFQFKGLLGFMMTFNDSDKNDYSYYTIGSSLPEHTGEPNDVGVRWMQVSYFIFGLAMPLAMMVIFVVLWILPLSLTYQRHLFFLAQVLNAWSALDVFCLAIAASLLEIQQFALFVFRDYCGRLNVILENYFDELLDGDDRCIDVVAYLKQVKIITF